MMMMMMLMLMLMLEMMNQQLMKISKNTHTNEAPKDFTQGPKPEQRTLTSHEL